jgi:hypothetical protein
MVAPTALPIAKPQGLELQYQSICRPQHGALCLHCLLPTELILAASSEQPRQRGLHQKGLCHMVTWHWYCITSATLWASWMLTTLVAENVRGRDTSVLRQLTVAHSVSPSEHSGQEDLVAERRHAPEVVAIGPTERDTTPCARARSKHTVHFHLVPRTHAAVHASMRRTPPRKVSVDPNQYKAIEEGARDPF